MNDLPLIIKFVEVVLMEVLVGAAVVALLVAIVQDIVEAKVIESRRRDQITLEPEAPTSAAPELVSSKPAAAQPVHPSM